MFFGVKRYKTVNKLFTLTIYETTSILSSYKLFYEESQDLQFDFNCE